METIEFPDCHKFASTSKQCKVLYGKAQCAWTLATDNKLLLFTPEKRGKHIHGHWTGPREQVPPPTATKPLLTGHESEVVGLQETCVVKVSTLPWTLDP